MHLDFMTPDVWNGLVLAVSRIAQWKALEQSPLLDWMVNRSQGTVGYNWGVVIAGGVVAAMILTWFGRLPYQKTKEEQLQEAIRRGIEADDEPLASTAV